MADPDVQENEWGTSFKPDLVTENPLLTGEITASEVPKTRRDTSKTIINTHYDINHSVD